MSPATQRSRSMGQIIRGVFFDDPRNKGTAALLALMIWWVAFNNTESTETLTLQVHNIVPPAGAVIVSEQRADTDEEFDRAVELTIKGQRRILDEILESKSGYYARFDIESFEQGIPVYLDFDDAEASRAFRFPAGVSIQNADPARVRVEVETVVSQDVFVDFQKTGDPRPPYTYDPEKVTITPAKVPIIGPRSQVEKVGVVNTETVDLSSFEGSRIVQTVNLRPPAQAHVKLDPDGPKRVDVELNLEATVESRDLKVPVRFSIPPELVVSAFTNEFSLVFEGPPDALDVLEQEIAASKVWGTIRVPEGDLKTRHNTTLRYDDVRFLEGMLPPGVEVKASKPAGFILEYEMDRQN